MKSIYKQKLLSKAVDTHYFNDEKIYNSKQSYDVALNFWDVEELDILEHFCVLYVNNANIPLCWSVIGMGGINGVIVDMKIIFAHALVCGATGLFLFHNHPSGNLIPSLQDRELTTKIKNACRILDMHVRDHIILVPEIGSYYSFNDDGLL